MYLLSVLKKRLGVKTGWADNKHRWCRTKTHQMQLKTAKYETIKNFG